MSPLSWLHPHHTIPLSISYHIKSYHTTSITSHSWMYKSLSSVFWSTSLHSLKLTILFPKTPYQLWGVGWWITIGLLFFVLITIMGYIFWPRRIFFVVLMLHHDPALLMLVYPKKTQTTRWCYLSGPQSSYSRTKQFMHAPDATCLWDKKITNIMVHRSNMISLFALLFPNIVVYWCW